MRINEQLDAENFEKVRQTLEESGDIQLLIDFFDKPPEQKEKSVISKLYEFKKRTCTNKRNFDTRFEANIKATELNGGVYKCMFCNMYHVTSARRNK